MTRRDFSERDIHMALDGELPGDERASYDAWIDANPEMKARSARYTADRAALRAAFAGVLDEPVPARIRKIVLGETPIKAPAQRSRWWLAAAAAVLLVFGGLGGYFAGIDGLGREDHAKDQLAEQAIAAHVIYAAEKRHAVEVPASDKDHLQDLAFQPGRSEAGRAGSDGRRLPAGRRPAAARRSGKAAMLLYEDAKGERISLFVTRRIGRQGQGHLHG